MTSNDFHQRTYYFSRRDSRRRRRCVRDGKIVEIRAPAPHADETIDLHGNFLAPGFIDVHVHGANGHDTMEANAEAFRAICDYHASGGTTSMLLTTATAPFAEILLALTQIGKLREEIPQIAGAHVEGPFISRDQAGAQNPEFICEASAELIGCLLEHRGVIKRITIAPETKGALVAIKAFSAAGIVVSGGHSNAWEEDARAALENGMRSATHTFNCMSSSRRRGTKRVAGLLEFALSEPKICCELIAEEHHVSPAMMKLVYCAKGVSGISLVSDATAGAGLTEETTFQLRREKMYREKWSLFSCRQRYPRRKRIAFDRSRASDDPQRGSAFT